MKTRRGGFDLITDHIIMNVCVNSFHKKVNVGGINVEKTARIGWAGAERVRNIEGMGAGNK